MNPESLGLSGARLRVVKTGEGCREQGEYLQHLGKHVGPEVLGLLPDGYEMEICSPVGTTGIHDMHGTLQLLQQYVWNRPHYTHHNAGWKRMLAVWLLQYDWLMEPFVASYSGASELPCLIHGDPTMANALRRGHARGRFLLGDPIQPVGKIPSFREVDIGKVLQSAMGWELMVQRGEATLGGLIAHRSRGLLYHLSPLEKCRAWFWAGVHCARLVPYAQRAKREDLVEWGLSHSRFATHMAMGEV